MTMGKPFKASWSRTMQVNLWVHNQILFLFVIYIASCDEKYTIDRQEKCGN